MNQLPSLRERMSDLPLLAEHFRELKAAEAGKQVIGFTSQAMTALRAYAYPGNVRELENIVERAVVLTRSTRIEIEDLPDDVVHGRRPRPHPMRRSTDIGPDAGQQPFKP